MTKKMIEKPKEITYFKLNHQVNIPSEDNKIQLDKDREAVKAYFIEQVNPHMMRFQDSPGCTSTPRDRKSVV